jgi:hypothetical protein
MPAFSSIALGFMVAGAATSAYGQYRSGQAQEDAANAQGAAEARAGLLLQDVSESQAQLAEYNAAVAHIQARDAIVRGEEEANRFRSSVRLMVGEQRAGFAAGNIDVGFGSAVDVQSDAALLGELDALTIRTNAAREAWGYRVEAEDLTTRAEIARQEGRNAAETGRIGQQTAAAQGRGFARAGMIGAAGSLLGAGGSYFEARYGFGRGGR